MYCSIEHLSNAIPSDVAHGGGPAHFAILIPGPVDDESLSPQVIEAHELPKTTIMAFVSVVSHDKETVGWNGKGAHVISGADRGRKDSGVAMHGIGFVEGLIVDKNLFVLYSHGISGYTNNSFDEILGRVNGILKNDDITSFWIRHMNQLRVPDGQSDTISKLIDQYMVANKQCGFHGP